MAKTKLEIEWELQLKYEKLGRKEEQKQISIYNQNGLGKILKNGLGKY